MRFMRHHGWDVPGLHPTLGAPSLVLNFLGLQVLRGQHPTSYPGTPMTAREHSAPLGIRTATVGMCSKESAMDRRSTFMARSLLKRWSPRPKTSDWHTCYTGIGVNWREEWDGVGAESP